MNETFKTGDLVRVHYSVPNGLQHRIMQIRSQARAKDVKTVGHYYARVLVVESARLFVINTYNQIRHYVHPKQCQRAVGETSDGSTIHLIEAA